MSTPTKPLCEHCNATQRGELCGLPMIFHEENCPKRPKPQMSYIELVRMEDMCMVCWGTKDVSGRIDHKPGCPADARGN